MRLPPADTLRREGARFLLFGAFNTLATYALYCGLVFVLHPQLAYAIVFALGIGLAYAGNTRFVFRTQPALRSALIYPGVYLLQYLANAAAIQLLTTRVGLGPRLALALALVVVTPLSFVLNRATLRYRRVAEPR